MKIENSGCFKPNSAIKFVKTLFADFLNNR